MSYIDSTLSPGEQIIFRTKKNIIVFFVPAVFFILLTLMVLDSNYPPMININYLFKQATWGIPYLRHIDYIPAWILFFITVYSGAQQWLIYAVSDYAITSSRVIMKEGFFERFICDLRLTAISNVSVDQSLLGQAMDYGTVVIYGFGGVNDFFAQINHPNAFQKALHLQLDKASPTR